MPKRKNVSKFICLAIPQSFRMPFRIPFHMPFRKAIPPFTFTDERSPSRIDNSWVTNQNAGFVIDNGWVYTNL